MTPPGNALGRLVWRALGWDSVAGWGRVNASTPTEYERKGREVRRLGWERNAVVNACVRAIVDIYAAVDLEVYRKKADGTAEVIPGHDALELLNVQPRIGQSGYAHRAQRAINYLLYGNAVERIERMGRRGMPVGLRWIHPERVAHVWVNPDDVIERWQWNDTKGAQHDDRAEDILHFRDLSADEDGLFGFPRAAAAIQDIAADAEATQYVRQIVTNHGQPGIIGKTRGYKQRADLQAAEEAFNEKFLTRGKRGGVHFINADELELTPVGFNLSELEFPDLRAIAREDICSAFGVDPRIIGIQSARGKEGGLSGEQYREARFRLIQHAVIPVMKAHEAELNRWLMPEYGDVYCRFSPDVLAELTEDETATSTRVIAEVKANLRTLEEGRETVGLSAEVDPAHHFAGVGVKLTTVGIALEQADMTPAEAAKEMAAAAPPPAGGTGPAARPPAGANGKSERSAPLITRIVQLSPDQRAALWGEFDSRASREEGPFVRMALRVFGAEQALVADIMRQAAEREAFLEQVMAELLRVYGIDGEAPRLWEEQASPVIRDALATGFRDAAASAGLDFSVENPRAKAAVRRRAGKLAGDVTGTTYEQIRGLLLVGRDQGLTVQALADLINETVFQGQAPTRSRTIARTESIGALNEGAYMGALEGGMRSKSWLSQRDQRVRESHVHNEGQGWLPIDQAFGNGLQYPGDQMGGPEEVINCRCTLLFSDEERPS